MTPRKRRSALLYDEMDWMKVTDSLNSALPEDGRYTNLEVKSFQITGTDNGSDTDTATVWSGNGVVTTEFTIESPTFILGPGLSSAISPRYPPIRRDG